MSDWFNITSECPPSGWYWARVTKDYERHIIRVDRGSYKHENLIMWTPWPEALNTYDLLYGPLNIPGYRDVRPRPAIMRLACEMERRLRAHDQTKPCWKKSHLVDNTSPLDALRAEVDELADAWLGDRSTVAHEAADVANYAMILMDLDQPSCDERRGAAIVEEC